MSSQNYDELPDEIWSLILTHLTNHQSEPLSLVNKHLLSLTNSNRHKLTVTNPTFPLLTPLLNRFNNLTTLNLSQLTDHNNHFLTALTEITNSSVVNTLTSLDISNHDYVPIEMLMKLGAKCRLRVLKCGNVVRLCDEDLRGVAKAFPHLEEVDLSCGSGAVVTDEGVECLARGLRCLVKVNLTT